MKTLFLFFILGIMGCAQNSPNFKESCQNLPSLVNTENDASIALQDCINNAQAQLVLPPGVLTLKASIRITAPITMISINHNTILKAGPNLYPQNHGMLEAVSDNVMVVGVTFDGNRSNRLSSLAGMACLNGNKGVGYDAVFTGNNITLTSNIFKNALCGSGIVLGPGNGYDIEFNVSESNGDYTINPMVADGMTVLDAPNSIFQNNVFTDNTDVDLVFGGCRNCVISNNVIFNVNAAAHAGLMIQAWPNNATSGDYTNANISDNSIACENGMCGFGLYIGSSAWYPAVTFGGNVMNNSVVGGYLGIGIDQVSGFTIKNNTAINTMSGTVNTTCGPKEYSTYDITPGTDITQLQDATNYQQYPLSGCVPVWN